MIVGLENYSDKNKDNNTERMMTKSMITNEKDDDNDYINKLVI